jgi:long-chain acyl-CoA synthetase
MDLSAKLVESARRFGSRTALGRASARVCALLAQRGIVAGEPVAVMLPGVPELAVVYYGVLRAGAIVVPVDTALGKDEVAQYMTESGARLLFAWHEVAEQAEAGAEAAGGDCLFVTPGEFERLLARSAPDYDVRERAPGDIALMLYAHGERGEWTRTDLTHAELAGHVEAIMNRAPPGRGEPRPGELRGSR